jgi:hypothetical protein
MDMAKTKVEQLETGTPIVLTYEVNDEQMATLKVLRFSDYGYGHQLRYLPASAA